ncbi:MAG: type II toxin-antitoxin system RelE/ParE family toxin [Acidobacteria bacterium]|nr:type II toxin-antitoxin system RelE/ParE family toxin [Acidobacteriota bacterium]
MLPVIFRPLAAADAAEAKTWYSRSGPDVAERFVATLVATVSVISDHPYAFQRVAGETRRAVLRRFPYAIYYRITTEAVIVLAVHGRQDPAHWKART